MSEPTFYAYVPGQAVPQGSKTALISKSTGRAIVVDKDRRLPEWRTKMTVACLNAKEARTSIEWPLRGPVAVTVTFVIARPKHHYGTGRNAAVIKASSPTHPAHMPDLDKLLRAVFDAVTDAAVWVDDAQVVWVQGAKRYRDATPLTGPGVHIWVEPLS